MTGVDVADQLWALYSSQIWSHKRWHHIFWFLVDTSIVNIYVMHLNQCTHGPIPTKPMTHLEFKSGLCYSLLQFWETQSDCANAIFAYQPSIHMTSYHNHQHSCVVCGIHVVHTYCHKCNNKFMCWWNPNCYET